MTGSDIVALGPRLTPAPQGRKSPDEKPGAATAAPAGQKAASEPGAGERKDREAEDFDAALKQEDERAGDPPKADEKAKAEGRKAAKADAAGPEAEAEPGQAPAAEAALLPVAQPQPPVVVAPADPAAAVEGEAAAAPVAAAPAAGAAVASAAPAGPLAGNAELPPAPIADQTSSGTVVARPDAVPSKAAPAAEKAEAETGRARAEGDATAATPRAEMARPQPHAAAPAAPPPPAAAGDARVALPDPAAGGLTLTPTGNVDWRLSAQAAAQAFPREAASHAAATAHSVIGQITLAVGQTEDRRVEIRLDPPELGRVHIHLTPTEQGLQATVVAERPETHALLRRHGEALARDLGDAGYGNVSLDFAAGGRETPTEGDRRQAPTTSFAAVASAPPAPGAAPGGALPVTRGGGDGALDIRL